MVLRAQRAASGEIADIRKVTVYYFDSSDSHLVHKDGVEAFIEAQVKLHFEPGVNPHNQKPTKKIWKITASALTWDGPFWWSTPDLMNNGDPAGVKILDGRDERVVWVDRKTVEAERAAEERAEYEAATGQKLPEA